MKYIYLLIFFLSAFSSNNALAFWNKVSDAQKEYCLKKAETFGSTTFTSKKRYQQCIREIKEANIQMSKEEKFRIKELKKEQKAKEKYSENCSNNLFESYKEDIEYSIYYNSYGDIEEINSFIDKLNINRQRNGDFYLSNNQRNLIENNVRDEYDEITKFRINKRIFESIEYQREEFLKKLNQCAIDAFDKSKSFLKFF